MTFQPTPGQDIRVVYAPDTRQLLVEQVRIRRRNGAFHPEDLGSITDLDQEFWELRGIHTTVEEAVMFCLNLMLSANVQTRSIDLGPTPPQAAAVQTVLDKLATIRV